MGIFNATNVTLENLTAIVNVTDPMEFFINVNTIVYDGWLFFVLLSVLWVILFITANRFRDEPLNNSMYSGAIVTVASFLLRGIIISRNGVVTGLLTDHQLWVFPVITIVLAVIVWATKPD